MQSVAAPSISVNPIRPELDELEDLQADDGIAVLTLAWCLRRGTNERFLLTGTIDLFPRKAAPANWDESLHRHEISRRFFVFARRYTLDGRGGLAWYLRCRNGDPKLPEIEQQDAPLLCENFLAEPPWPGLQCQTSSKVPGSCCELPGRTASLIPSEPGWEARYWSADERVGAIAFLRDTVGFDFDIDPEYLGAAHLVAADPELRSADLVREEMPKSDGFRVRVVVEFHSDTVDGFTLILRRHRPKGEEAPIAVPLRGGTLIDLSHKPHLFSFDVLHERRGLVFTRGPVTFLDGFSFEAALVARSRKVTVPKVRLRLEETF